MITGKHYTFEEVDVVPAAMAAVVAAVKTTDHYRHVVSNKPSVPLLHAMGGCYDITRVRFGVLWKAPPAHGFDQSIDLMPFPDS